MSLVACILFIFTLIVCFISHLISVSEFFFFTIMRHNKFLIFMSDNDTFNAFNARHIFFSTHTACIQEIFVYNVASINVTATHHLNSSHVIYHIVRL